MNLPTEIFGDVVVVHSPSEIGKEQAEPLHAFLTSQVHPCLVIDLDGAEAINSAGLTAMLDSQEQLRGVGGDLKVTTANPVNRKILEITRLDQHLDVFDNVIDAVKSYA